MSIIQQIREKAAWLVFGIIGLSLIGFLLMDAKPGSGGLFGSSATTIGTVDGKEIELADYQQKIKRMEDQYAAQGYPMNEMMRQNLQEQVWNQYIQEDVLEKEIKKLGLDVTAKEIDDMLFVNPSPELRQSLTDPETGRFDPNRLKQQIAELKKKKDKAGQKQFNEYIVAMVKQRLTEKYTSLLGNTAYVPKWMIEKNNADNSSIASISYVNVPYSTIVDSTVKVTDEEIEVYVKKHKEEFKQEVTRNIYYVSFDASPSSKDTADLYNEVAKFKGDFSTATDPAAFLIRNGSETAFHDGYITKSKLSVPNADTIRQLADGAVYGPYLDGGRYTLAKMISKREMPDSVKVRHILIGTVNPQNGQPILADSIAQKRADSIAAAIKNGADFAMLTLQYSTDEGSKKKGGEYEFASTQFSNLAKEFAEATFYGRTGDKKIIKTSYGYHYIEVMSQKNFEPAYKIAYLSKTIIPSTETDNSASGAANQFAGESRTAKAFEENAAKRKYNKMLASDLKPNDMMIPGVGTSRQLVKWIYQADKGEVSEPYSVADRYVVAMVSEINAEGTMSPAKARPMVEYLVRNKKKAEIIIKKIGTPASLEAVATGNATQIQRADSVGFSSGIIPNVGQEGKVVGAAFNKQLQGKISPAIAGNGGVFIIKTENISAVPNMDGDIEQQRQSMLSQMKSAGAYKSMEALRKAAKVKDNRAKFF